MALFFAFDGALIVARVGAQSSANLVAVTNPLLEAKGLRVDVGGTPEVDGLTLSTTGDRVLVLAGPAVLFQASAGMVTPSHGELLVEGLSPQAAIEQGVMVGAPLDPPLPPSWTVREYVTWSGRLAGDSKADAAAVAEDVLEGLKLGPLADTRLRHASLVIRRAVVVAASLATGPTTLLLEDPLRGLPEDTARGLARTLVRATAGLRMAIFAARASLASPVSIDADEALVLDGSTVVGQGAPAEVAARDRSYAIRLHGPGESFAALAAKRGVRVAGRGVRWTVDLGASLEVRDLLEVAAASHTVILELRPLAHAFA